MAAPNNIVITHLFDYYKKDSEEFHKHPYHSKAILDIKAGYLDGRAYCEVREILVEAFREKVKSLSAQHSESCCVAIVPSSKPYPQQGNFATWVQANARGLPPVQPDLLRRTKEVPKKATGGSRDIESERDSIEVHGKPAKTVVLVDDVTTTGTSFRACAGKLLEAGAENVICIALGKTKFKKFANFWNTL